jgi:PBP1b-binding outer membrane lipoprotein LpoB
MLEVIQEKIKQNDFELSKHAVDQSIIRNIRIAEIKEAIAMGKIIEDYPDDKYGASYLIVGFTAANRPLHI